MIRRFTDIAIQLHPSDNIAIAKQDIQVGEIIEMPGGKPITILNPIPSGHKVALQRIECGEPVVRYANTIGQANQSISPGSWVHMHNLSVGEIVKEYSWKIDPSVFPKTSIRNFDGYHRPDGRVGTRNYIAVISTVSCSAHVVMAITRTFNTEILAAYPNVDGVIPIVHHGGCSFPPGGLSHSYLQRVLLNVTRNPNIGGFIFVGLGCEANQMDYYCNAIYANILASIEKQPRVTKHLIIQEQGGFQKTVRAGINAILSILPEVNACGRTPQPISKLNIALQCGGSDGWSGVTANPLVGSVVDEIIKEGGTAVLAETPEIFGAEHLLTGRVINAEVGNKLIERFLWWNEQSKRHGFSIDNNPTPGNKAGGLTTIFEKSLGAVAKGGSTPLTAVYEYGQLVEQPGLVFMDTPGNDPVSITGQLAGGCNMILFTTGRGSVYSSNIAPCIKIASNSSLYRRMIEDMDYNAGQILEGRSMPAITQELFDLIIQVASGQPTKSEENGLPETEFIPWQPDAVL